MTTIITDKGMITIALAAFDDTGASIDQMGGQCPVQVEGRVDGQWFYFRARGQSWQFHVAPSEAEIFSKPSFYIEGSYGEKKFAAGYMPDADALLIMTHAINLYRIHRDLQDGWKGQADTKVSFIAWVEAMAENPKGTLRDAAKAWLAR